MKQSIKTTIGYYIAFASLGLSASIIGPTLPGLAENTHSTLSEISIIFTAHSLGYLIGSLLGGKLYDKIPGHKVLIAVLIGLSVLLASTPFFTLRWLLAGILLLTGCVQGALDVGGNTLIVWLHGSKVGPYISGLHLFWGIGAFVAPLIVAQVIIFSGNSLQSYWVLAVLMLPAALWLLRQPSTKNHDDEENNHKNGFDLRLTILIMLIIFGIVGGESSFSGWLATYVLQMGLGNEATASYINSALWAALTVGRLAGIPLALRLRPRTIIAVDLIGTVASLIFIVLWRESITALWVGTITLGFFMATIFPMTLAMAERQMHITGQLNGIIFAAGSAGSMLTPWLIGQYIEPVGAHFTILAILGSYTLALIGFTGSLIIAKKRIPSKENASIA